MKTEMIVKYFDRHQEVVALAREKVIDQIHEIATILSEALRNGNKVLVMGNGGSAADAQHMAAELVGRFKRERRGLPAIALTTDTSILTAIGNDYGFDRIFARQVEALASPGDVVIGISTSGNSTNVLDALSIAKEQGCRTVGMLGKDGGAIARIVDMALIVPVNETAHVQEVHLVVLHILCDIVEAQFSGLG